MRVAELTQKLSDKNAKLQVVVHLCVCVCVGAYRRGLWWGGAAVARLCVGSLIRVR